MDGRAARWACMSCEIDNRCRMMRDWGRTWALVRWGNAREARAGQAAAGPELDLTALNSILLDDSTGRDAALAPGMVALVPPARTKRKANALLS